MGDVFSGLGTVALASLSAGMQVPSVILPCRNSYHVSPKTPGQQKFINETQDASP